MNKSSDRMDELRLRVEVLEAKDAIAQQWNRYLHALDMARTDELLEVFAPDCVVDTMDSPPGSGHASRLVGHEDIRRVYGQWQASMMRHHGTNLSIDIDGDEAEMSAWFLRTGRFEILGGMYEGRWKRQSGRWRITYWRVATSHSWKVEGESANVLDGLLSKGTIRGGRPVLPGDAGAAATHPDPPAATAAQPEEITWSS